jgi:hypothetical protein
VQAHRDVLLGGAAGHPREHGGPAGITRSTSSRHPPARTVHARRHARRTARAGRACSCRPRPLRAAEAAGTRTPDDPPLPPPVSVREARALAAIPEPTAATSSSTSRATRSTPRATAPGGTSTTSGAWSTPTSTTPPSGRTRSPKSARRSSGSSSS